MDELELLRQRVQQLEKELAEARQIQTIDRISPIELYKMRAFLAPLKGFVRTLLDDEKEEWYTREDRREFYSILEENIDRLSDLNMVWQGEKKETLPPDFEIYWQADVDVRKIAESVVAVHQRQTNKHTLVVDFEPPQIFVEADVEKIEFLLNHIVAIAIKYSPNGGEVRVSARLQLPDEEWNCETLLLQVKDQGFGLSEAELRPRGPMFGPKKRPDILLTTDVIKAHHGKLWPESEGHGKGSTFNVRIPVKQPERED